MTQKNNLDSKWLFIAPVAGLNLTTDLNEEIRIGNVTFVSRKKLPRIRKRLGIPVTISELDKIGLNTPKAYKERLNEFFRYSPVYGICSFSGVPKENQKTNIRLIEEAIHLISFSNLGHTTRKFNSKIEIKHSKNIAHFRTIALDKIKKRLSLNFDSLHPLPIELDNKWQEFHKSFFFLKFLKIINGEITIKSKWKNLLISSAKIVGESLNSHNIPEAFLKNVIALEMLLVGQSEKIEEKLIERSSYLLDWAEHWKKENIEERIRTVYKKRCDYVHDGKTSSITKEDLIFTDDLIFNIFNNIINCVEKIDSKGTLIEFSDKYKAEKKLSLTSQYQFGKFQYLTKTYESIDIDRL